MQISIRTGLVWRLLTALVVGTLAGAGCGLDSQDAPPLAGPSEFALSVTVAATPDQLPRDGTSKSLVTVSVRDAAGRPDAGRALSVSSDTGTVSANQVRTGSDGVATFSFVAPDSASGSNEAVIRVVPVGADAQNAVVRTVVIQLAGTSRTAPTASFSVSPSAPSLGQIVVFDASASTDEGVACLDSCTYLWDFGGEAALVGRLVSYQFLSVKTYPVRLTVTDRAGSVGSSTQNVTVSQGTLPTAAFAFSPTSPGQFQLVNFTAAASAAGAGKTIAYYDWRFGDGSADTGMIVSHPYNILGTYTVTLTVTDSAGLKSSTTNTVTVVSGVVAAFTVSPQPVTTSAEAFFDTEGSRGSDTGFGSRNVIVKYIWNFGESDTLEETTNRIMRHTFTRTGTLTVTLTVVDAAGRRQTTNGTITVTN